MMSVLLNGGYVGAEEVVFRSLDSIETSCVAVDGLRVVADIVL